jgi:hypothetical protein
MNLKVFADKVISPVKPQGLPDVNANQSSIHTILSIAFITIGALAVLMIVISGLRYILAGGDTQRAAKAREGIVYALIGLVIAISAQAIVTFVVNRL